MGYTNGESSERHKMMPVNLIRPDFAIQRMLRGNPVIRVDFTYFNWTDVNGVGRLKQITSGIMSDLDSPHKTGAGRLQDLRYTYDANGNVRTIKDYKADNPQTQSFTYDELDRLSTGRADNAAGIDMERDGGSINSIDGTYAYETYTYESSTGNISSKAGVSYTYGDSSHVHAVTATGPDTYTYDANGNQITRNVGGSSYTLSYDAENRTQIVQVARLVGVSRTKIVQVTGAVTATFVYDGDGNRVKVTIGENTSVYLGNYFEWTGSTSTMKRYYYEGSVKVAMRTGSSTLNYLLGDHLGSNSITTNSSGVKNSEIRYMPWGTTRYTSGSSPTTFQYTGQRVEAGLGLLFYNARYYDPLLGRFIQADTIVPGGIQGLDRYAYVGNNPLKYTDPSGHDKASQECGPDGMYCEQNRIGCNNIGCKLWHDYGVKLIDKGSSHGNGLGAKAWDYESTVQVYFALGIANNAINGKLKYLIGGSEFTLNNYTEDKYHGNTGNDYIDFETGGAFPSPYINIFHEIGHLIDANSSGGNYYSNVFKNGNHSWITPEGKIDISVLNSKSVVDPYWPNGADSLQGTNYSGTGFGEQWADTFANYVAGNINTSLSSGDEMTKFVSDFFFP